MKTDADWLKTGVFSGYLQGNCYSRRMPFRPEDQPRDVDLLIARTADMQSEIDRLHALLKLVNDARFGARSERGSIILSDQASLDLGDLGPVPAAANDDDSVETAKPARRRARRNIGALPKHFPRVEQVIEPEVLDCACCSGALHRIGEDVSEAVDWVPATVRVVRTIRPRYACRQCQGGIVQAPAPKRIIEGGMATTSTLAWIATMRFAWSVPLNRQMQMLAGQGLHLDRSVPVGWMKRVAWWLEGLYERQLVFIHSQPRIFCDETRMSVLEKGRRRTRIGQFWAHAIDDRPWNGPAPPAVVYVYKNGCGQDAARQQLEHYAGILQVDGYAVYKALAKGKPMVPASCLAHARRKFVEAHKKIGSQLALDVIARIAPSTASKPTRGARAPTSDARFAKSTANRGWRV
jgi:transposase